jgi:hypothetical protein
MAVFNRVGIGDWDKSIDDKCKRFTRKHCARGLHLMTSESRKR